MKCQSLFTGKHMKNINNLLSSEFAQRVVKVKVPSKLEQMTLSYSTSLKLFFRQIIYNI